MYHYARKIEEFTSSDKSDYSKFKHGCKSLARKFGKELARTFIASEEFKNIAAQNKTIVVCSAPHNNIPTASFTLKDYFISGLASSLLHTDIEIEEAKIHRKHSYTSEYGEMSAEERFNAISADTFHIDAQHVSGKHVIFVDDCRITGAHEDRIKYMVGKYNLNITCSYVYYASIVGSLIDPKIENELNHFSINRIEDILDLIISGEFVFNTRVVKKILRSSSDELVIFVSTLLEKSEEWGVHVIATLITLSTLNNYHKDETMTHNILHLASLVESFETVSQP